MLNARDRSRPHGTDGSARAASIPSTRPEARRAFAPPPACTPSMWDKSGKPTAAAARTIACSLSGPRSRGVASRKYAADFAAQLVKWRIQHVSPGVEHHRPICWEGRNLAAHRFFHTAPDAIPFHCFADRARDRKSETRRRGPLLAETEGSKVAAGHADTGLVDLAEFRRPENPLRFREHRRQRNNRRPRLLRGANSRLVADRQLVAALGPPARQHGPAVRRLHAFAKAVSLSPVAVVGLKCAFWHCSLFDGLRRPSSPPGDTPPPAGFEISV